MTDDPGFIRRWSRRKQAARRTGQELDTAPADGPEAESGEDWTGISQKLQGQAEALHALVDDDAMWTDVRDDA